jgi:hypothetical protein
MSNGGSTGNGGRDGTGGEPPVSRAGYVYLFRHPAAGLDKISRSTSPASGPGPEDALAGAAHYRGGVNRRWPTGPARAGARQGPCPRPPPASV